MEIRKITKNEKKEYYKMTEYAFETWYDRDPEDNKLEWMKADEALVLLDNDKMASGLVNSRYKQSVHGVIKGMAGVGNVATYPEYRNKGYVRKLFMASFNDCMDNGLCLSALQPFREEFYQKFGYISTAREVILNFHVSAISHYLDYKPSDGWEVTRDSSDQSQKDLIAFISKEAKNYHGMVLIDNLDDKQRRYHFRDKLIVLIKEKGNVVAGCAYSKKGMKITIIDVLWTSLESRKALFNFFAKHRDQVGDFSIPIPMSANFYNWFRDADKEYKVSMCDKPWMVRVVDIIEAFRDIPLPHIDNLTFEVSDDMCEWNRGLFNLNSISGKAVIKKIHKGYADFSADIKGIAALLYGALPIDEIIDRNWLQIKKPETLEQLHQIFLPKQFFNQYWF